MPDPELEAVTIFAAPHHPDPARALDVLAFVLAPVEAFTGGHAGARAMVIAAQHEAASRWERLQPEPLRWA